MMGGGKTSPDCPTPAQAAEIWASIEVPHALAHDFMSSVRAESAFRSPAGKASGGARPGGARAGAGRRRRGGMHGWLGKKARADASAAAASAAAAAAAGAMVDDDDDGGGGEGSGGGGSGSDDESGVRLGAVDSPDGGGGATSALTHGGSGGSAPREFAAVPAAMRTALGIPVARPPGGAGVGVGAGGGGAEAPPCGAGCHREARGRGATSAPLASDEAAMLPRLALMAQGDWCVAARLLGRPCAAVFAAAEASGLVSATEGGGGDAATEQAPAVPGALPTLRAARVRAGTVLALQRRSHLVRQVRAARCCCCY